MQRQIQILRQLVLDAQYAVDETTVAEAIIARATARRAIMGTAFRNDIRSPQVRSFRPTNQARSFRPCNAKRSMRFGNVTRLMQAEVAPSQDR
jgi:hypothetical protein